MRLSRYRKFMQSYLVKVQNNAILVTDICDEHTHTHIYTHIRKMLKSQKKIIGAIARIARVDSDNRYQSILIDINGDEIRSALPRVFRCLKRDECIVFAPRRAEEDEGSRIARECNLTGTVVY